ncbi:hypothetical protein GCM10008905_14180 [Clostridium malenominatum]|uniref:YdhG-like domain-containing protein n=2 Tax=Clostridium malenominatum TaxID=1539 RepID=A0ABP3U7D1_9CLOT
MIDKPEHEQATNIIREVLKEISYLYNVNLKGEIMEEDKNVFKSIDEYILQFSPEVQEKLQSLRNVIKESAPDAEEKMSWQMPTFALYGNLVHFAAHKKHIGFYPGPSGIDTFKLKLSEYKWSKGAVQFPIEKPLPYELIGEIVRFRVAENIKEAESKLKKRKK